MRRNSLIWLVLSATLAWAAVGATAAFAEDKTKFLPEGSSASKLSFTLKGGETSLELKAGDKLTCRKSTGEGSSENANSGPVHVLFTECTGPLETTCTSTGAGSGLIEFKGEFHFLLALLDEKLVAAFVILFEKMAFVCKSDLLKDEVTVEPGCIAGLAGEKESELNALVEHIVALFAAEKGVQDILDILPLEATKESECKTEAKILSLIHI